MLYTGSSEFGLPVLMIGISVAIFKLYEIILVIFNPKRL